MLVKICSYCGEIKQLSQFSKNKRTSDGLQSECKACNKLKLQIKTRTKHGLCKYIYKIQKQSSRKRGHKAPEYSELELTKWLHEQFMFHVLYDEWKNSNYDKWLKPSIDRIDDNIGYCFSNIQLMTWRENDEKRKEEERQGLHGKSKPVIQIDGFQIVARYHSAKEAHRQTGIHYGNIKSCASGSKHKAGGYYWRYV